MDREDESDEFSEMEKEEQFIYHKPTQKQDPKVNSHLNYTFSVKERCEQIQKNVLENQMKTIAYQICKTIQRNQSYQLLIPFICKRNQVEHIEKFISILIQKIKEWEEEDEDKRKGFLKSCRKFNIYKEQEQHVKDLVLQIYFKEKQHRLEKDIMTYAATRITNLQPNNVYIFQDGLPQCPFIIILPTYHDFSNYPFYEGGRLEVIPHYFYDPKELFCQFMFQCIVDQKVKAYLPRQAFKLVSDFDDYPISYAEGCRRLIYCITKRHLLLEEKNLLNKIQYIKVGSLFEILQKTRRKQMPAFRQTNCSKTIENTLRCLLDETYSYSIFQFYLNKIDWFNHYSGKDENTFICDFRDRLKRYMEKDSQFSKYIRILEGLDLDQPKQKKKVKKNRREDKFKIQPQLYKSEKNVLEDQIAKIIRIHTEKIRVQGKMIEWSEMNFEKRIKPQIPLHIYRTIREDTKKREVLDQITSHFGVSLIKLINKFCSESDKQSFGKFMHLMKDLELYGMIDTIKNGVSPTVTPGFFLKSSFTRQEGKGDC